MNIKNFNQKINLAVFTTAQALRLVPVSKRQYLNLQLSRWVGRGELWRLKRGVYQWPDQPVEEAVISNLLYQQSYVSLETVLNTAGVIPDVPAEVTAVTTKRPKKIKTPNGLYSYSKLRIDLYFGYSLIADKPGSFTYRIASPEKALLDYMYVRRVSKLSSLRLDWQSLKLSRLKQMMTSYPDWVKKELTNYV